MNGMTMERGWGRVWRKENGGKAESGSKREIRNN
jgi:hypothetical protein